MRLGMSQVYSCLFPLVSVHGFAVLGFPVQEGVETDIKKN